MKMEWVKRKEISDVVSPRMYRRNIGKNDCNEVSEDEESFL